MLAATASGEERENYLKEVDTYLMEGLTNLYSDVNAQVKALAKIKGPLARIKDIDSILSYINEDMQMIPRYVGLRVYLFNYRGKTDDVLRILGEYRYQLQTLAERKLEDGKYTALELIHKYYPYDEEKVDFWLKKPMQMLEVISSYETMLAQKDRDVFYLDVCRGWKMSNSEKKERRCLSCKKLLLDEKLYCRRCLLEKRNRAVAPFIIINESVPEIV